MPLTGIIALVNVVLPQIIALWRKIKDIDPNAATFTDAQVIEMLDTDSQAVVDKANAWLATHPSV